MIGLGLSVTTARSGTVAFESVGSGEDVLAWIAQSGGGASGAKPRWPGMATTANGLDVLHAAANWGVEGTAFSRPSGLPSPANANTLPAWDAVNKRLLLRDTTPVGQLTMNNVAVTGIVNVASSTAPITISNSVFDGAGLYSHAIFQNTANTSPITVRNCEFYGYLLTCGLFYSGTYSDCYFHDTQADAIWFGGHLDGTAAKTGPKRLYRNMARKLGQVNPATHADCLQTSGNVSDIITFGNMLYMPAGTGSYNEGAYGTTNCMNFNTDAGDLSEILCVNDCLIGGGYTVSLCPDPGDQMNGAAMVGCWFSKPYALGGAFTDYGSFYTGAANIGLTRNILIHNCRYLEDGSPVIHTLSGTNAQGLWNYDKSAAPARFRQVCRMLGYTDWNDDPLVAVRTGFHAGNVVWQPS